MRGAAVIAAALMLAGAAGAQDVASGSGALLRALDKVSGVSEDIEVVNGQSVSFGRLSILVSDCRFPVDDPSSNAFAHLTITDTRSEQQEFDGWMIASSPALSALDDPRYDVWVLRCRSN